MCKSEKTTLEAKDGKIPEKKMKAKKLETIRNALKLFKNKKLKTFFKTKTKKLNQITSNGNKKYQKTNKVTSLTSNIITKQQ